MNTFDRTRKKIKEYYRTQNKYSVEDAIFFERNDLQYVDYCEKEATKSFINSIKYRFKVKWNFLSDDIKTMFNISLLFALCGLIIAMLFRDSMLSEFLYHWYIGTSVFGFLFIIIVIFRLCIDIFKHSFLDIRFELITLIIASAFVIPAIII